MPWLYLAILIVVDLAGLVLAAFTLPGTWLMLAAAAAYALLTHGAYLGWRTLIALLLLTLGAEIGEFVLGGAGAKKAGASKWGIFGGLVGAILGGLFLTGFIPIPILGTVIGICLGSFAGAFAVELLLGGPLWRSVRIGVGAAKGRLLGIIGKFTVGLTMLALSVAMAWPTGYHPPARRTATNPSSRPATRSVQLPPTGARGGPAAPGATGKTE